MLGLGAIGCSDVGAAFSPVLGADFGTWQPVAVVVDVREWATLARNGPVSLMRVRTPSIVAGMAPCALPFSTKIIKAGSPGLSRLALTPTPIIAGSLIRSAACCSF